MQRICFVFYYNYNYCYHPVNFSVFQLLCFRCVNREIVHSHERGNEFSIHCRGEKNNTKNFQTKYNNTDMCTPNTEQNIIYSFKVIQSLAYSYKDNTIVNA